MGLVKWHGLSSGQEHSFPSVPSVGYLAIFFRVVLSTMIQVLVSTRSHRCSHLCKPEINPEVLSRYKWGKFRLSELHWLLLVLVCLPIRLKAQRDSLLLCHLVRVVISSNTQNGCLIRTLGLVTHLSSQVRDCTDLLDSGTNYLSADGGW